MCLPSRIAGKFDATAFALDSASYITSCSSRLEPPDWLPLFSCPPTLSLTCVGQHCGSLWSVSTFPCSSSENRDKCECCTPLVRSRYLNCDDLRSFACFSRIAFGFQYFESKNSSNVRSYTMCYALYVQSVPKLTLIFSQFIFGRNSFHEKFRARILLKLKKTNVWDGRKSPRYRRRHRKNHSKFYHQNGKCHRQSIRFLTQ